MNLKLDAREVSLVRSAPMFGSLHEETFRDLIDQAQVRDVNRSEVLFIQGDPVKCCFMVLEGWVKLYRLSSSGDEAIVATFTRGQSFAEAAAFTRGVFPVSGEAVTECRLLCIPVNVLIGKIRSNPEIGLTMLASTSLHLQHLVRQIEQLKSHTGAQRVAEFLVSLSPTEAGPCTINLPYDKVLVAGRLGMKPESLSRAFAKLRKLGIVMEQNAVNIEDIAKLRTYAQQERVNAHHIKP